MFSLSAVLKLGLYIVLLYLRTSTDSNIVFEVLKQRIDTTLTEAASLNRRPDGQEHFALARTSVEFRLGTLLEN